MGRRHKLDTSGNRCTSYAEMRSDNCLYLFTSDIFLMKALTNSLASFDSLSARETKYVLRRRSGCASGRTVTPLRAMSKAPALTRNATADPSATNGNASSGAVMCWIFDGLMFCCSAACNTDSYSGERSMRSTKIHLTPAANFQRTSSANTTPSPLSIHLQNTD